MSNARRAVVLLMSLVLATGCEPFAQPDSMLDEYNRRLARVLDLEPQLTPLPPAPGLPGLRYRVRELEPISLSLLDFFRLYGCELQVVVGERNSILGRVAHPLTRLDYERRFIIAAEACLETITRPALAEQLAEATAHKRAMLPTAIWNAVWGSREIESHFTRSRGALPVGLDRQQLNISAHQAALLEQRIRMLLQGELEPDLAALDAVYQRWRYDPLAGQALRSAMLVSIRLNDASALLEQRLDERPLCRDGRSNRQAETLRQMFGSVYAGHIQPYLAAVQQVRRELLPPLLFLASFQTPSPSAQFDRYVQAVLNTDSESNHWQAFDEAIARHTRAWQALLDQCGLPVGARPAWPAAALP